MTLDADRLGPVEYALIAFPGNSFNGQVAPALARLVASGMIHIIDLTFVTKDADGTVTSLELDALAPGQADGFADLDGDIEGLLTESDIAQLAAGLEPESSGLLVVWSRPGLPSSPTRSATPAACWSSASRSRATSSWRPFASSTRPREFVTAKEQT